MATLILTGDLNFMGVTDPDADPLKFSVVSGPLGLGIDPTSGLVTWTPAAADLGAVPPTTSGPPPSNGLALTRAGAGAGSYGLELRNTAALSSTAAGITLIADSMDIASTVSAQFSARAAPSRTWLRSKYA